MVNVDSGMIREGLDNDTTLMIPMMCKLVIEMAVMMKFMYIQWYKIMMVTRDIIYKRMNSTVSHLLELSRHLFGLHSLAALRPIPWSPFRWLLQGVLFDCDSHDPDKI